jgi:protein subunit release factor B
MNAAVPDDELSRRMAKLGIREEDLREQFTRGTGAGGQKINKTSSTVQLLHEPSGIEVRCQRERSQSANRHWARVELCDHLEEQRAAKRLAAQQEQEKDRRRKRKRPRGLKERILETKHRRSDTKQKRGRVRRDD